MAIMTQFLGGLACPFFRCDVCGERITTLSMAMAAWGENDERAREGSSIKPAHVHKGECLSLFEANLAPGEFFMTEELRMHLAFLVTNSGMDWKQIKRELELSELMP